MPHPRHARSDIQQQEIRDLEIDPKEFYPAGYHPELLREWPVDDDFVMRTEDLPPDMRERMGEAARDRAELRKAHGLPAED